MLKLTLSLIVLLSSVQWICAFPQQQKSNGGLLDDATRAELNESFQVMVSSAVKFFSKVTSATFHGLLSGTHRLFIGLILRWEFYTIASGNQYTPNSPKVPKYYKIAAFIVSKCWMKLDRMEQVDELIRSATDPTIKMILEGEIREEYQLMEPMFEVFESYIKSDPQLEAEFDQFEFNYDQQKHEIFFNTTDTSQLSFEENMRASLRWLSNDAIQKMVVNKIFLRNSRPTFTVLFRGTDYERVLIVKSILSVARRPEVRKMVQKLYDEAVAETADLFEPGTNNVMDLSKILFEKLSNKFESSTELKDQYMRAKKEISKDITNLGNLVVGVDSWLPF